MDDIKPCITCMKAATCENYANIKRKSICTGAWELDTWVRSSMVGVELDKASSFEIVLECANYEGKDQNAHDYSSLMQPYKKEDDECCITQKCSGCTCKKSTC